jgi:hypothetical protein
MTTITVTVSKSTGSLPPDAKPFSNTKVEVIDNAGNKLDPVLLSGGESPPWTAVFTGTVGSQEAQAIITDLDTEGNPIGDPITVIETGTGGQGQAFPQTTGATITVQ